MLRAFAVVRPPRRHWRAYAALAPKAIVLAHTRARRRALTAVSIAVTGSVGKTTTKDLLKAALLTTGPTVGLETGANRADALVEAVRSADRGTRFIVQEVGLAGAGAGTLDEILWTLEPRVSVVTTVRSDHFPGLDGLEGIAREKIKAVAVLPREGLAVLNADDPRTRAMAAAAGCRVVLVGKAEDADVRIAAAERDEDGRLVVRLRDGDGEWLLRTQLLGIHWATAVALAFATATRLGAEPDRVVAALTSVPPTWERLNIVTAPTGARFLLDTAKATEATVGPSLAAFAGVPARRRIAVIGWLWDFLEGSDAEVAGRIAADAFAVADEVLLYGRTAAVAPPGALADPRVRGFDSIAELSDDVWGMTGPGDLVLLMGTFPSDHLSRIALRVTHDVRCRRDDCTKRTPCNRCPLLGPLLQ